MNRGLKAVVLGAEKARGSLPGMRVYRKSCEKSGRKAAACYVLDNLNFIDKQEIILVVGYMKESVFRGFPDYPFAVQSEQLGTGPCEAAAESLLVGF